MTKVTRVRTLLWLNLSLYEVLDNGIKKRKIYMSVDTVKFNVQDRPEFFKELRKRVNKHFKDNNISKYGDTRMQIKSAVMITLYTLPLILMLTGVVSSFAGVTAMWILMGFGISGIGLAIMHDANHGAYSKNKTLNSAMGFLLNFIGGYPANWRIQHNVLHHTFTNIDGYDEDIEKQGIVRFSPNQPKKGIYKFQVLYAPILYGILTIYWFIGKDFEQLVRYNRMGLLKGQDLTFGRAFAEILFHKLWYIGLTIVLPIILIDLPWWQIMTGFLIMHFMSGLILALIFQTAHVIEETNFYLPDEKNSVENNWAIHQLHTTANYANKSSFFSWFIGGLNYQIEHHLFPTICHVHFKEVSKIVKETAKEYDLPYHHHTTFLDALKSHFSLLYKLGMGKI